MRLIPFILSVLSCTLIFGQLRPSDKTRIGEARRISTLFGDSIWKGYDDTPFAILYIMDDYEYLMGHGNVPDDFEQVGYDSILGLDVYRRPTQMNKGFLATFPFAGVNTIVIGTPENTGLNSSKWIITLLHERFHQYQYASPGYFKDVNALDLANGDKTGMWMLNYPFPYKDASVIEVYETYTQALYDAVGAIGEGNWENAKDDFLEARDGFKSVLSRDDYKYISFQWYLEGIARYTEYAFLEKLENYEVSNDLKQLPDFVPFDQYKKSFFQRHLDGVINLNLEDVGRITVYDVGFAEALILCEVIPEWRDKYLDVKFDLEKLYR